MNGFDRTRRSSARHPGRAVGGHSPLSELLNDDHVGGLLARIRAVGCLIGAAADIDPEQISAAGWLVEALADEAQRRLKDEIRRERSPKARPGRHRPA